MSVGQNGSTPGRILVAEDNPANRKLALAMLRKLGYAADAVTNGLEAIEAVERSPYEAVLMDCRMPAMDGFQATEAIRRREDPASRMPIIAMTADAMEGDRQRCLDAGMDDYVSKPVSFESLAVVLRRWVSSADATMRPPPSPSNGPVEEERSLDPAIISSLRQLETRREREGMPPLISVFLEDVASNLERLRQALEREEEETIRERAHALAGTAASFGARPLGRLCGRLKTLGSQGRFGPARETMAEIEAEFDRVREALRAEFPDRDEESA